MDRNSLTIIHKGIPYTLHRNQWIKMQEFYGKIINKGNMQTNTFKTNHANALQAWRLETDILIDTMAEGQAKEDMKRLSEKLFSEEQLFRSKELDKSATNLNYTMEVLSDKQLRKDADEIIQRVKDLPQSRERSLAITKFQEGVMWLGMDLKRLGEANPYPSSKAPETGTTIEPTADGLKL